MKLKITEECAEDLVDYFITIVDAMPSSVIGTMQKKKLKLGKRQVKETFLAAPEQWAEALAKLQGLLQHHGIEKIEPPENVKN